MNSKTAIKNVLDVPNKYDKQGSSLAGNSVNGDIKITASESRDYRIGFSKSNNRGLWIPYEADDVLCLEVGNGSLAFMNRNGVKDFSPNLVGGYHLGSDISRWDTVKVKDLDASQYLKIKAYSGYGSGNTSIWYDNTGGKKALALGGVAELSLEKAGTTSTIRFAAQNNDPAFIEHYENNNVSRMRFSVSDDAAANQDYFEWGATEGGNWSQAAKLNANGTMYLGDTLYVHGNKAVWHSGNFDPNTKSNNHDHPYISTSASCNKNWAWAWGDGQPTHVWGSTGSSTEMRVFDPSGWTVNYSHNTGKMNGKNIFIQQGQPSAQNTGDVWISW